VINFDLYGKDQSMFLQVEDQETQTYQVSKETQIVSKNSRFYVASYDRSIESKSIWERFLAIFAGPMMNILLAIVIFFSVGLLMGRPNVDSLLIGDVQPNSPALLAGIEPGSTITSVNGIAVQSFADLSRELERSEFQSVEVQFDFNNQNQTATLNPRIIFYAAGFASDFEQEGLVVAGITERTIAGVAGMQNGDEIISINQTPVTTWREVASFFQSNTQGQSVNITVQRGEAQINVVLEPYEEAVVLSQGVPLVAQQIGISASTTFDLLYAVQYGFIATIGSATSIVDTVRLIFSSNQVGVGDLAGPVGIFSITSQAVTQGLVSVLGWMGFLSINVAVINLLPIPALDGGRLLFLGVEAVMRRPINREFENKIHTAMFFMLLAFFVIITWNDILRLFG
jgi:regulator of sigma E protease